MIDSAGDDNDKDTLTANIVEKLVKREAGSEGKKKRKLKRFLSKKKRCKGNKCKSSKSGKGGKRKNIKKRCKGSKCKSSKSKKVGKRKNKRRSKDTLKSKGKRQKKPEDRQSTDYSTCFPNIFQYTVRLKKARNIQNQFKRINSSRAIIVKKKGKKDDFSGTLDILVSALGGDKSAPKCSQSRAFNGDFYLRIMQHDSLDFLQTR